MRVEDGLAEWGGGWRIFQSTLGVDQADVTGFNRWRVGGVTCVERIPGPRENITWRSE